jgi:AraC-like DNA-binding protein
MQFSSRHLREGPANERVADVCADQSGVGRVPIGAVSMVSRTIHDQYRRPLTVGSLARECGLSERSLHRHYRAATGRTIARDLLDRRLEVAAELLRSRGAKLEQVAAEAGLRSAKNLCRLFKLHVGVTPGRWKETNGRMDRWNC